MRKIGRDKKMKLVIGSGSYKSLIDDEGSVPGSLRCRQGLTGSLRCTASQKERSCELLSEYWWDKGLSCRRSSWLLGSGSFIASLRS